MGEIPVRCFSIALFILRRMQGEVRVLVLRRRGSTQEGQWCQVAGHIEDQEPAWQTALREAREETGLALTSLWSANTCEHFYEAHRNRLTLVPVFIGWAADNAEVVLNHEHDDYRWATFAEAATLLPFPGQRELLGWIQRHFIEQAPTPMLNIPIPPAFV